MNIDEFWQLIDKTRVESNGNADKHAQLLEDSLVKLSTDTILRSM